MIKHLLTLGHYSEKEIFEFINLAEKIKKYPEPYSKKLHGKTLLMLFAKPSLRTHLSFDVGMYKLGGHSIFYDLSTSPLGKKESIKDGVQIMSRYVDIIMARLYEHRNMMELAKWSRVPIINGLDDLFHPCQVLGDLLTIKEKFGKLSGLSITYIGDANNNVTHDLLYGCAKVGINIIICCPNNREFLPNKNVFSLAKKFAKKATLKIIHDPKKAVVHSEIIYTDTWQSYHIPDSAMKKRIKILKEYQVNSALFNLNKKAVFMHCLPATRNIEVTDDVIDNKRSIIYDQAHNRLWIQMAILIKLLNA